MAGAWIVYLKELVDALRDRRTLLTVLAVSCYVVLYSAINAPP